MSTRPMNLGVENVNDLVSFSSSSVRCENIKRAAVQGRRRPRMHLGLDEQNIKSAALTKEE